MSTPAKIVPAQPQARSKLGLILVVGFVLALVAGALFAALADWVLDDKTISVDEQFGAWLLSTATPTRSLILFNITQLANSSVVAVGLALACGVLWRRGRKRHAVLLLVVVVGAGLLNVLLKGIFVRPRPDFADTYYRESGFSFPSGHAMLGVVFYGMLAYAIGKILTTRRTRLVLAVVAVVLALVIGFSRIYLGVHYLSDVVAGWSAGACWLAACIVADEAMFYRHERDKPSEAG